MERAGSERKVSMTLTLTLREYEDLREILDEVRRFGPGISGDVRVKASSLSSWLYGTGGS